jgi:uncharacterized protein (DUF697 family)
MSTFESYETGYESGPFETQEAFEGYEVNESYETYEGEDEQFLGSILGALTGEGESPLSEAQEMELTAELLEIQSEEELEEFLGNLVKGVAKKVGGFIKSPIGKQLTGVLKNVAKKALPIAGSALGSFIAPGVGTAIGGKLGSMASNLFELEAEGMNQEQLEFEMGRRVVRLAASSAATAATAPRNAPPRKVVQTAVTQAARQHAPGLLRGTRGAGSGGRPSQRRSRRGDRPLGMAAYPVGGSSVAVPSGNGNGNGGGVWDEPGSSDTAASPYGSRSQSGRWVRRGRKIVLIGI